MTGYRQLFAAALLGTGLVGQASAAETTRSAADCRCALMEEAATDFGQFKALIALAMDQNLIDAEANFTVFAPSNAALSNLPPETIATLTHPAHPDALVAFLKQHMVKGIVSTDVPPRGLSRATNLAGQPVELLRGRSTLRVADAKILKANVESPYGYLHVIDRVLSDLVT